MKCRFLLLFLPLLFDSYYLSFAQIAGQPVAPRNWNESWIEVPDETVNGYEMCLFRKSFTVANKRATYLVHVSLKVGRNALTL